MTKTDLEKKLAILDNTEAKSLKDAIAQITEYRAIISAIEYQSSNRSTQVLNLLKQKPLTIADIATQLNTTNKNVSSVLSALRKTGYRFSTDADNKKILEQPKQTTKQTTKQTIQAT